MSEPSAPAAAIEPEGERPAPIPSEPIGIQILIALDKLKVHNAGNYHSNFLVFNADEELVLTSKEEKDNLGVLLLRNERPFRIDFFDTQQTQLISLERRRGSLLGSYASVKVFLGNQLISVIHKRMTFIKPVLWVTNPEGHLILKVKGSSWTFGSKRYTGYNVFTPTNKKIGCIKIPYWRCLIYICFDGHYDIEFPEDLDVRYKIALLATCVYLDFLFYQ